MFRNSKQPQSGSQHRRRWSVVVLLGAAVVLAAALGYYIGQQSEPAPASGVPSAKKTPTPVKGASKAAGPDAKAAAPAQRVEKRGWLTKAGPKPDPKRVVDPQTVETVVAEVVTALDDPNPRLREKALERLESVDHPAVNTALSKAIRDSDEDVRETAMDVMGEIGSANILDTLSEALTYGDEYMREAALDISEDISDPRTVDLLIEKGLLNDNTEIQQSALAILEGFTDQEFSNYEEARKWWDENRESFQFYN